MEWTKAQHEAITSRGSTLLVSAGAGSGKTAVLTERIVSLLREGTSLDEMLVVTFTRAAAAEMRERIINALHKAASMGDHALANQIQRVERASITTFHGFCAKVCREYFHVVRADPMFRVVSEVERTILVEKALYEALLSCFETPIEYFSYAAECLEQDQLKEAVKNLYQFIQTRPNPFEWLDQMILMEQKPMSGTNVWENELMQITKQNLENAKRLYNRLLDQVDAWPNYHAYILKELEYCITLLTAIPHGISACANIPKKTMQRKPNRPKDADESFEKKFTNANTKAREMVNEAYEMIQWLYATDTRNEENEISIQIIKGLAYAAKKFYETFTRMKFERNLLDYDDLEHYAYIALQQESIGDAYQSKYKHVFVDEYQDSSLLQEQIIQSVCREGSLFMVGDVKQSIYRFRQAEPSLFLEKLNKYSDNDDAKQRNIYLNENFRSHPRILHCINQLFEKVFIGDRMEILYDQNMHLVAGREWDEINEPVELHILQRSEKEELSIEETIAPESEPIIQEARIIAERVLALRSENKAYRLRDMVILLRVMKGKARKVADTLRQYGIAAKADIGEDTLCQVEVQDVLSILKTIDNFHQDIPLIASLKGPTLGLSAEEIASIRVNHPQGSFSEAVIAYTEKENTLADVLRKFISDIEGWSVEALVCPLDSLIRRICEQKQMFQIAGAMPDGRIRQEHLHLLAETAAIFQQQEEGGLSSFLRYIDRVQKREGITAQNLSDREEVIRILSIHKSKGLEFPIVFIAGLGSTFSIKETAEMLQMHPALGIGVHAIDPVLRLKQDTIIRKAIVQRKKMEALAEQARILYVALTRAESRLILVGTMGDMDAPHIEDIYFARSFIHWIFPVASKQPGWKIQYHSFEGEMNAKQNEIAMKKVIQDIRNKNKPLPEGDVSVALSWHKPYQYIQPLKQSVTQRVHKLDEQYIPKIEELPARPLFLDKKGLTSAEVGEATHTFLRSIPVHERDFQSACRRIVEKNILSEEHANALPAKELQLFLNHPIWIRISNASEMYREWAFNLRKDVDGGITLLQGIIDCCFIEEQQWVLVDYKTDHAKEEQIIERHQKQVLIYADALEKLTGIHVSEKIIYSIALGKALAV